MIQGNQMRWVRIEKLVSEMKVPQAYSLRSLRRSEISSVIKRFLEWYPGVRLGSESRFVKKKYYTDHSFMVRGQEDRKYYPIVFTQKKDDGVIGLVVVKKDSYTRTVMGFTGALDPEHRGLGIAHGGPMVVEALGRKMGAEFAYFYASLQIPHTQRAAEKMGFSIAGILPHDLDVDRSGKIKRVYEALYAKLLVSKSSLIEPNESAMTERTKLIWSALKKSGRSSST